MVAEFALALYTRKILVAEFALALYTRKILVAEFALALYGVFFKRPALVKPPVDEGFLSENSNILTAFKKIAGFMELCSNLKIE